MSERGWIPGDVAEVCNEYGVWNTAICTVGLDGNMWRFGVALSEQPVEGSEARRLVVLDPEDATQMRTLTDAFHDVTESGDLPEQPMTIHQLQMRAALLAFSAPQVLEHYPARRDASGLVSSLCGKVWRPTKPVRVMSRCGECADVVESGWTA